MTERRGAAELSRVFVNYPPDICDQSGEHKQGLSAQK